MNATPGWTADGLGNGRRCRSNVCISEKLQYPINVKNSNPRLASVIISQYGGPDGELGASLRYLSQRYAMPYNEVKAVLTDIGTEEYGPGNDR